MKRLVMVLVGIALLGVGGYYGLRLMPLALPQTGSPEQVVLLHGLGRTERAMVLLESAIKGAGFEVHNIGYPSRSEPPERLLEIITAEVQACCPGDERTVHFVGHSLGGLMIRAYLAESRPDRLGRVVQLGSPNHGSELADVQVHPELTDAILEMAGPAAEALSTGPDGFPASLPPVDYPVGVIAGTRSNPLSDRFLPTPNDGMVSVESAKLPGMTDFMTIGTSHFGLRNNRAVADAVVRFLTTGRFED